MAPRRRCPVCGSKQWHKEPSSGLITCSEGHVLQNYRSETYQVDDLGPHALRKRALKSRRKKKEKRSKADPKLYHGDRARYHYFQCLQLLLRMQIAALTEVWVLPPEFEVTCRDIWALHLYLLPSPPPAEPLYFTQGEQGKKPAEDPPGEPKSPYDDGEDTSHHNNDDEDESASSSSESDSEEDPEIVQLMEENSESSSSNDEADADIREAPQKRTVSKKKVRRQYDAPASNIAVLMVACWTLRLPVLYMDFVRLIETYELPYLDPIRLMSDNMTTHLTKHTANALSPHHAPTPLYLHRLTARLARLMNSTLGILTPELNAAPILWRAVRGLGGTPTLYVLTKKVAWAISLPLTLHRSLAPGLRQIKKNDPTWHKFDNAIAEVSLAAAVIIVLKMVYGLDGKSRSPEDKDDVATALPRLQDYLAFLDGLNKANNDAQTIFSSTSQKSVLDLNHAELDSYLNFCERALLPREDRQKERNAALDFFAHQRTNTPLEFTAGQEIIDSERPVLPANLIDTDERVLRPGQTYTIHSTSDLLGSLPAEYETVVGRAARWAGVDEDYVCGVVERFERRLVRWWDGVRTRK